MKLNLNSSLSLQTTSVSNLINEGNKEPGKCNTAGFFRLAFAISFQSYTVKVSKRALHSHELNDLR